MEQGEMSKGASVVEEVARMRKWSVDRAVDRFIAAHDGDVSTEQIEEIEADALREWRTTWPALNGLLIPHATGETGAGDA